MGWETVMNRMVKVTMLMGLAAACAGGQPPAKHPDSDNEGVQQAIRFERAKQAAAARQAEYNTTNAKDTPPSSDDGVQAAIRFERAKDAAAARQARREANHPGESATSTAASRR
jgi:hypothetical protein